MAVQHAEKFFLAFRNKKFLSRKNLAISAGISTVSADKLVKSLMALELLKERKSPQRGEIGRPGRVLYLNPRKFLLVLSLAGDDCFHVFVHSLSLAIHTSTSYPLHKLLTREENIVTFFRETVSFLKHYLPDSDIISCAILLPSRVTPKRLWDTVCDSAIENHARRFFSDIPCYFYTEMRAGARYAMRENENAPDTCVKITPTNLHIGVARPDPEEIDLSTYSLGNRPLSDILKEQSDISAFAKLLSEVLYNLSLMLGAQKFLIDHTAISHSAVFTEKITTCLRESFPTAKLSFRSLFPEETMCYISGCADLLLHHFLKFHLNGGTL